jgi:hypothetical protein
MSLCERVIPKPQTLNPHGLNRVYRGLGEKIEGAQRIEGCRVSGFSLGFSRGSEDVVGLQVDDALGALHQRHYLPAIPTPHVTSSSNPEP